MGSEQYYAYRNHSDVFLREMQSLVETWGTEPYEPMSVNRRAI